MTLPIAQRIDDLEWGQIEAELVTWGYARTSRVLSAAECRSLRELFAQDAVFRTRVQMEQHRFGVGDYAYFARPLPSLVEGLRKALYRGLAPVANRMSEALGREDRFPRGLGSFLARCRAAGQTRPTPLLLRYAAGGYNCLHQDRYGEVSFPLQVAINLSQRGREYEGGALLLVEQRPRAQSRGEAVTAGQGELVIFPSLERPVPGRRGMLRCAMRHGASRVLRGERHVLGIIFHDAR